MSMCLRTHSHTNRRFQSHSICTNENNSKTFDLHEEAHIVRHRRIHWMCVGGCVRAIAVMKSDDIRHCYWHLHRRSSTLQSVCTVVCFLFLEQMRFFVNITWSTMPFGDKNIVQEARLEEVLNFVQSDWIGQDLEPFFLPLSKRLKFA